MNTSEFIRKIVLEKIEDEIDLITYKMAIKEYRTNPQTFTFGEVKQMLNED